MKPTYLILFLNCVDIDTQTARNMPVINFFIFVYENVPFYLGQF
jgi:hypothetical protein